MQAPFLCKNCPRCFTQVDFLALGPLALSAAASNVADSALRAGQRPYPQYPVRTRARKTPIFGSWPRSPLPPAALTQELDLGETAAMTALGLGLGELRNRLLVYFSPQQASSCAPHRSPSKFAWVGVGGRQITSLLSWYRRTIEVCEINVCFEHVSSIGFP